MGQGASFYQGSLADPNPDRTDKKCKQVAPPRRVDRRRQRKEMVAEARLHNVIHLIAKCKISPLKEERVKDYLAMEEVIMAEADQERSMPEEEEKVDDKGRFSLSDKVLRELLNEHLNPFPGSINSVRVKDYPDVFMAGQDRLMPKVIKVKEIRCMDDVTEIPVSFNNLEEMNVDENHAIVESVAVPEDKSFI